MKIPLCLADIDRLRWLGVPVETTGLVATELKPPLHECYVDDCVVAAIRTFQAQKGEYAEMDLQEYLRRMFGVKHDVQGISREDV